jgi:hypothetical protein
VTPLPDDTEALKAALIETRARFSGAQALIRQDEARSSLSIEAAQPA